MLKNLTEYEIPVLPEEFNLTDGHMYRAWSSEESKIIDRATDIFKSVHRQMQPQLEAEYVRLFMELAEQRLDSENQKYLICTTASEALEIVANYMRLAGKTLSFIEPCFDNLADIYKRHDIPLTPFPDECLESPRISEFLANSTTSAICLVTPNNPTGTTLTQDNLAKLLKHCKERGVFLVLDTCFRAYTPHEEVYDQYGMLIDSGIDYAVIEDTGKTWPTMELKVPILAVSNSVYQPIYDIYTDFLYHVSPFSVQLMTEFIKNSIRDNKEYLHHIVRVNRNALYRNIEGTFLTPVEKQTSVSWLKIKGFTSFELKDALAQSGIHILPGDYFYWSNREQGKHYIRISLSRDPESFAKGAELLGGVCRQLQKEYSIS